MPESNHIVVFELIQWPKGYDSTRFIADIQSYIDRLSDDILRALILEFKLPASAPRRYHDRIEINVTRALKRAFKGELTLSDIRYRLTE